MWDRIGLDYIHRNLITSGELKRLVEEDGLRGVTSNPTIFEKAIAETRDYDEALCKLLDARAGSYDRTLYEALAVESGSGREQAMRHADGDSR